MSKLYDCYLKKKLQNDKKIYLFKNGNFYLFLGEDAKLINKELNLKLTKFSNESQKCGFPVSEFKKYTKFIALLGYDYEVVLSEIDQIIKDIIDTEISNINGEKAIGMIKKYKDLLTNLNNERN